MEISRNHPLKAVTGYYKMLCLLCYYSYLYRHLMFRGKKDQTVEIASQTSILVNDNIIDLGFYPDYKPVQL